MRQRTLFQLMPVLLIFLLSSCRYAIKNDLHPVYANARYGEDRFISREGWYSITRALRTSKDFAEEAKAIRVPVLYLYGEDSSFREMARSNVDFFRAALPNTSIVSFQNGIHDLEQQKPGEVASLVLNFLENSASSDLALFPLVFRTASFLQFHRLMTVRGISGI